jgi:hypothetical protein
MKIYTKEDLIEAIREIANKGWHKSVKATRTTRNDGAVGNTLEELLGLEENNLPIPNANDWELKGQRTHTKSLITLKHREPSPTAVKFVPQILLPLYGWRHKEAGGKYPENEMSFRSTTSATQFTNRGFRIIVDRELKKIRFIFDASQVDVSDPDIKLWLQSVESRVGLEPISPEPYWGFDDLKYLIGTKLRNCFYVVAESKVENKQEYFKYIHLFEISGFSFERFLQCVENGIVFVEFDARTGHNHGTKLRLKPGYWADLFSSVIRIF